MATTSTPRSSWTFTSKHSAGHVPRLRLRISRVPPPSPRRISDSTPRCQLLPNGAESLAVARSAKHESRSFDEERQPWTEYGITEDASSEAAGQIVARCSHDESRLRPIQSCE